MGLLKVLYLHPMQISVSQEIIQILKDRWYVNHILSLQAVRYTLPILQQIHRVVLCQQLQILPEVLH